MLKTLWLLFFIAWTISFILWVVAKIRARKNDGFVSLSYLLVMCVCSVGMILIRILRY